MIRPLRQRHRRIVIALGVLLPIAFVAGIAARKSVPAMASLPAELAAAPRRFAITKWNSSDLFANTPIQTRLLLESAGSGHFALEFSGPKDFVKPDLLVYWVAGKMDLNHKLPDNAVLLGAFNSSAPLPLPQDAVSENGELVLYSLANQQMVEVSKPFTFQNL